MHRLLKRQLKRNLGRFDSIPEGWEKFLNAVSEAYEQSDTDRRMLERTIELNSQELLELNTQIRAAIPDTFLRIDQQGTILDYKPGQDQNPYFSSERVVGEQLQVLLPESVVQKFMVAIDCLHNQGLSNISIVHELIRCEEKYFYEARFLPLLENQYVVIVRDISERTRSEAALKKSQTKLRDKTRKLGTTLADLKNTQAQLVQTEKMSGLGHLVAGIAHEINNPVNFVNGNISYLHDYVSDLIHLLNLYQTHYPEPVEEIRQQTEDIDLDFLLKDLENIRNSMALGVNRISEIVRSLRTFSRLDEADMKEVNIHDGIESTLLILNHRLKANGDVLDIEIKKDYGQLPPIECYAGQLNQVFMNVIVNAIDALEVSGLRHETAEPINPESNNIESNCIEQSTQSPQYTVQNPQITISTEVLNQDWVSIQIANNGPAIPDSLQDKLFDPFFTTKPVGEGTGLGLSISYQIVVSRHGGRMWCHSQPGQDTVFGIEIPIHQVTKTIDGSNEKGVYQTLAS